MKTVILSAFKAFGDYPVNSTEVIAKQLNGEVFSGFKVRSAIFSASIPQNDHGVILRGLVGRFGAIAIVSMGMASEKKGLCVESVATNRIYNEKYCPRLNGTPVDGHMRYGELREVDLLQWNISAFQRACRSEGIPVTEVSNDAGGFCCNHLMYQVLVAPIVWRGFRNVPFVFLHTPCSPEAVPDRDSFVRAGKITMTTAQITRGLELLLKHSSLDSAG